MAEVEFPWGPLNLITLRAGTLVYLCLDEARVIGAELHKIWDREGIKWTPVWQPRAGAPGGRVYNRRVNIPKEYHRHFAKGGAFSEYAEKEALSHILEANEVYGDRGAKGVVVSPHLVLGTMSLAYVFDREVRTASLEGRLPSVTYHMPLASTEWFGSSCLLCPLPFYMVSTAASALAEETQKMAALEAVHEALGSASVELSNDRDELTQMLELIDALDVELPSGLWPSSPKVKVTFSRPTGDNAKIFKAFFWRVSADRRCHLTSRRPSARCPATPTCCSPRRPQSW